MCRGETGEKPPLVQGVRCSLHAEVVQAALCFKEVPGLARHLPAFAGLNDQCADAAVVGGDVAIGLGIAIERGLDEMGAGAGAPVAEQAFFEVLRAQRFALQGVVLEVDLGGGEEMEGPGVTRGGWSRGGHGFPQRWGCQPRRGRRKGNARSEGWRCREVLKCGSPAPVSGGFYRVRGCQIRSVR